jgi:hypothetical protein
MIARNTKDLLPKLIGDIKTFNKKVLPHLRGMYQMHDYMGRALKGRKGISSSDPSVDSLRNGLSTAQRTVRRCLGDLTAHCKLLSEGYCLINRTSEALEEWDWSLDEVSELLTLVDDLGLTYGTMLLYEPALEAFVGVSLVPNWDVYQSGNLERSYYACRISGRVVGDLYEVLARKYDPIAPHL